MEKILWRRAQVTNKYKREDPEEQDIAEISRSSRIFVDYLYNESIAKKDNTLVNNSRLALK